MPGPAVILTYHRIAAGRDPLQQCVSPANFAAQLDALAHVAEIVPLGDLERPASTRRVAITFDDGYRDNATAAAPLLRAAGAPAHLLHSRSHRRRSDRVLAGPARTCPPRQDAIDPALLVEIDGTALRVDLRDAAGVYRSLKTLNRRLRPLSDRTDPGRRSGRRDCSSAPATGRVTPTRCSRPATCPSSAPIHSSRSARTARRTRCCLRWHPTSNTTRSRALATTLEEAVGSAVDELRVSVRHPESFDRRHSSSSRAQVMTERAATPAEPQTSDASATGLRDIWSTTGRPTISCAASATGSPRA